MRPTEIDAVVREAARLTTELYVFPDVGAQLAGQLAARLAEGRYAAVADAEGLALLVTEDLQAVNGDRHLRLLHHVDEVPDLPGEAMMAAMVTARAAASLNGVCRVERLDGNVALLELDLLYPPRIAGATLTAAMQLVASASALVLDLRRCAGGDPDMVALLCSYLVDEPTHLNDIYERGSGTTTQSWTLPYVPGPRLGATPPVYVLTSGTTFSGGEELAYDLQQLGRATVVGEPTRGGAHPRVGRRLHPHLELSVPVARAVNPVSGTNWEGVGVQPDVLVPAAEALEKALSVAAL